VSSVRRRRLIASGRLASRQTSQHKECSIRTKAFITLLVAVAGGWAQVLAPEEIRDPQLRALQQKYRNELKLIPHAIVSRSLPYRFYFSKRMDLAEEAQKRSDQRSIQFDRYQGRLVLKITGNYFVSYSDELIKPEDRARMTYETIMLPLLEAAVHALDKADVPEAFAFEVSHHVRKKVLGVPSEGAENVVLVLPKASAQRLVAAENPGAREAALFEGEAFLNAVPISIWHQDEETVQETTKARGTPRAAAAAPPTALPEPTVSERLLNGFQFPPATTKLAGAPPAKLPDTSATPTKVPDAPAKAPESPDNSPTSLKDLQQAGQPTLDRMVKELDSQAHFVSYAPPAFIPFRSRPYLQLSVTTTLPPAAAGSQYRLAALAFDQHVSHLIRPVLAYFKDRSDFDGIDFSTTVRVASGSGEGSSLAVEFIFPLKLLSFYADFDCTGQQLIDAAFVLINGERVSLNLQAAEAGAAVP
jgi:hypothetical protein